MQLSMQRAGLLAAAIAAALVISACGGSSGPSQSATSAHANRTDSRTVTVLMGTAPDSLDPQSGFTTQSSEATWISYLGLLTYAHSSNPQIGDQLIPALATALPKITDGGRTYTLTLRKGLEFSNGTPVTAGDFTYTVERNLKMPWPGSGQFVAGNIVGAQAYAGGRAKSISGISTNDATGRIVIHLTNPYGAFGNVLAFPSLGLVPKGTPMRNEANDPPPGVGPYMITDVVPNVSFDVVKDPRWASMSIPGIPAGHVDVDVKIQSNTTTEAEQVLNNSADIFDWADTIPGPLLTQIQSQASDRYSKVPMSSVYYTFLNTQTKPFDSQLAREAVVVGLDQNAMSRLSGGTLQPGCYFLPPPMIGHPTVSCPYGNPAAGGDIAKAKRLVQQSGMEGQPVTVWSGTRAPHQQWMAYYTGLLNQIGFKATQKVIADATYFPTVGNRKLMAQTGFAGWSQDFPNPIDFYSQLSGSAVMPTNNEDLSLVNDPHINSEVERLGMVPTQDLSSVASEWQALDEYVAKKAYVAVFGYQTFPKFTSDRIDQSSIVFSPLYGWDYSSLELK